MGTCASQRRIKGGGFQKPPLAVAAPQSPDPSFCSCSPLSFFSAKRLPYHRSGIALFTDASLPWQPPLSVSPLSHCHSDPEATMTTQVDEQQRIPMNERI